MNELTHTAKAALNVLARVRMGLERIAAGNGSAALLPTLSAQLQDAVRIIDMQVVDPRLNKLAAQLSAEFGAAPMPRAELLQWLGCEVARVKATGVTGTAATDLIDSAYLALVSQHG
jgi:hypothetical protein